MDHCTFQTLRGSRFLGCTYSNLRFDCITGSPQKEQSFLGTGLQRQLPSIIRCNSVPHIQVENGLVKGKTVHSTVRIYN